MSVRRYIKELTRRLKLAREISEKMEEHLNECNDSLSKTEPLFEYKSVFDIGVQYPDFIYSK